MLARNTRFFSSRYRKANSCVHSQLRWRDPVFSPRIIEASHFSRSTHEHILLIFLSLGFFYFHLHRQPRNTGSDFFNGNSLMFMTLRFKPGSVCDAAQNQTSGPGIWPICYQMCWNSSKCVNIKYASI